MLWMAGFGPDANVELSAAIEYRCGAVPAWVRGAVVQWCNLVQFGAVGCRCGDVTNFLVQLLSVPLLTATACLQCPVFFSIPAQVLPCGVHSNRALPFQVAHCPPAAASRSSVPVLGQLLAKPTSQASGRNVSAIDCGPIGFIAQTTTSAQRYTQSSAVLKVFWLAFSALCAARSFARKPQLTAGTKVRLCTLGIGDDALCNSYH